MSMSWCVPAAAVLFSCSPVIRVVCALPLAQDIQKISPLGFAAGQTKAPGKFVALLIDAQANVDLKLNYGMCVCVYICLVGVFSRASCSFALCSVGRCPQGLTALHIAAREHHREAIDVLIKRGARIRHTSRKKGPYNGSTPFHLVFEDARRDEETAATLTALLRAPNAAEEIDSCTDVCLTPLVSAVRTGCVAPARVLLEHKANVHININGVRGCTLLNTRFVSNGNTGPFSLAMAKLLVLHGVCTHGKSTTLSEMAAMRGETPEMISYLRSVGGQGVARCEKCGWAGGKTAGGPEAKLGREPVKEQPKLQSCANPNCQIKKMVNPPPVMHLKTCSRCKNVAYCSVECQRQHFKVHKPNCKAPETQHVKVGGRT